MTKEKALEFIEKNKINLDDYKIVIVTNDNAVYLNSELEPIKAHCESTGKTYFVVKSVEVVESKQEDDTKEVKSKRSKKQS
jgi:hypothetical protein